MKKRRPSSKQARLDPAQWDRVGGRRFELIVPLPVFREWLARSLPPEFAPYVIVGEDRLRSGRKVVDRLFSAPLETLARCLAETPDEALHPRAMLFIGSHTLTPGLARPPKKDVSDWLLLSGLPAFTVGAPQQDGVRLVGDLIEVDQIEHATTGERRSHPEYLRVYRAIVKAARAQPRQGASSTTRRHKDAKVSQV